MKTIDLKSAVSATTYPGRGIIIGANETGHAVIAYFIMGRSENSRNRIFMPQGDELRTEAFDPSKMKDPSLIIYNPVRVLGENTIVTNGDQTDTVWEGLKQNVGFSESLATREFEPDGPNFTPRISAMLTFGKGDFTYDMSILKSADAEGTACNRYTFSYPALAGLGHFIHTYVTDGNPIPTFQGEPERMAIAADIDNFAAQLWTNLDEANKISLYVRYTDLETGAVESRIINKNK